MMVAAFTDDPPRIPRMLPPALLALERCDMALELVVVAMVSGLIAGEFSPALSSMTCEAGNKSQPVKWLDPINAYILL
jgi:hypothetical protein